MEGKIVLLLGMALLLLAGCPSEEVEEAEPAENESALMSEEEREALEGWDMGALMEGGRPVHCAGTLAFQHSPGIQNEVDIYLLGESVYRNTTVLYEGVAAYGVVEIIHEDRYYNDNIDDAHEGCDWVSVDLEIVERCVEGGSMIREGMGTLIEGATVEGECEYAEFGEEAFAVEGNVCDITHEIEKEGDYWICD